MTLEELEKKKFDTGQAIISAIEHGGEIPFVAYKDYCLRVDEARAELLSPLYAGPGTTYTERATTFLCHLCHEANKQWWTDLDTGLPTQRNVGELLMLAVSELSEAMEGHRKDLMDDKLPHRKMIEVELADCLIRIFDMGGGLGLDLGGALVEKMEYNAQRADHKAEARMAPGGKKY